MFSLWASSVELTNGENVNIVETICYRFRKHLDWGLRAARRATTRSGNNKVIAKAELGGVATAAKLKEFSYRS